MNNLSAYRINRAHPLTRGLVFCAVPRGLMVVDLVSRQVLGMPTTSTRRQRASIDGRKQFNMSVIAGTDASQFANQTGADLISGPYTVFTEASLEVNASTQTIIHSSESVNGYGFRIAFDDVALVTNGFGSLNDNGVDVYASNFDALGANSENFTHRVMVTRDGTTGTMYAKGNVDISGARTGLPTAIATRRTWVNATRGGTGSGSFAIIAVWNRILSLRDYRALYLDPLILFAPQPRLWWAPASVAGTVFNPLSGRGGAAAQPLMH